MPIYVLLFFMAGAVTRYHLRTIETRWQILGWCIVAITVARTMPSVKFAAAASIFAVAAAIGAVAIKYYIERKL